MPNLVPEGHTDSPQLNNTLQLLAEYIQYKCTTLKRTTPHNCWQNISNTNIYLKTCKCPNLVLEGHTDSPQLNNTPQLLAEYIQYKCTSTIVGRTYPIQIYVSEHVHALTLCPKGTQTPPNLTTLNNCWQYISHTIYTYAFLYLCICIFRYDTSEYYC